MPKSRTGTGPVVAHDSSCSIVPMSHYPPMALRSMTPRRNMQAVHVDTPLVSPVQASSVSHSNLALVIEETPAASLALEALGFKTEVYHPRQIRTASTQNAATHIRGGMYTTLWVNLPVSSASLPPHRRPTILREIALWVRAAKTNAVFALIVAVRGRAWQEENLVALVHDQIVYES